MGLQPSKQIKVKVVGPSASGSDTSGLGGITEGNLSTSISDETNGTFSRLETALDNAKVCFQVLGATEMGILGLRYNGNAQHRKSGRNKPS